MIYGTTDNAGESNWDGERSERDIVPEMSNRRNEDNIPSWFCQIQLWISALTYLNTGAVSRNANSINH